MASRKLAWRHLGWLSRTFELVEHGRVIVTLRQRGWGFGADALLDGKVWPLDMSGLWRWTLRLRDEHGTDRASLPMGWRGQGTVHLADGRGFRWDAANWAGTRWTLRDGAGGVVAHLKVGRFFVMEADVELVADLPDEDLVALLAPTWLALVVTTQAAIASG